MSLTHKEAIQGAKSAVEGAYLCLLDADGDWLDIIQDLQSIEARLDDELDRLEEEE